MRIERWGVEVRKKRPNVHHVGRNAAEGFLHVVTRFDARKQGRIWQVERLLPIKM